MLDPKKDRVAHHRAEPRQRGERRERAEQDSPRRRKGQVRPDKGMERYRIEVGRQHKVKPGNIVGAIANEAGLDSQYIGQIEINEAFTLVDLPKDMPDDVFQDLRKTRVCGQRLEISRLERGGKRRKAVRKAKKRKKTVR